MKPFRAPDWYIILCLNETFSVILPQSLIQTSVVIEFSILLPPQPSLHPGGNYTSTLIALLSCSLLLLLPLSTDKSTGKHQQPKMLFLFSRVIIVYMGAFMKSSPGLRVLVLTKYCSQGPNSTSTTGESTEKKK